MMSDLQELLKCTICNDNYDNKLRKPTTYRICGHTFCRSCLNVSNVRAEIFCPFKCGKYADDDMVISNFALSDIIEHIAANSLVQDMGYRKGLVIETTCRLHEKVIVVYDFYEERFKCADCKKSLPDSRFEVFQLIQDYKNAVDGDKKEIDELVNGSKQLQDIKILSETQIASCQSLVSNLSSLFKQPELARMIPDPKSVSKLQTMIKKYEEKASSHIDLGLRILDEFNVTRKNLDENLELCSVLLSTDCKFDLLFSKKIELKPFRPCAYFTSQLNGLKEYLNTQAAKYKKKLYVRALNILEGNMDHKMVESFNHALRECFKDDVSTIDKSEVLESSNLTLSD